MATVQTGKTATSPSERLPPKRENMWFNLGFNLLVPILLLNKGEKWFGGYLEGQVENVSLVILLVAIAFPVVYFIYDKVTRNRFNLFSILGFASVLLTGGIGLFELPTFWFAMKEAGIPLLLGLAVILSLKTPYPLIRTFLYNPDLIDVEKISHALAERGNTSAFERLLVRCTAILSASFFLSAALNFGLARYLVVSPAGTEAFNEEVGKFMIWSWPIIVVPGMIFMVVAMVLLFKGIRQLTGFSLEDLLHPESKAGEKAKSA